MLMSFQVPRMIWLPTMISLYVLGLLFLIHKSEQENAARLQELAALSAEVAAGYHLDFNGDIEPTEESRGDDLFFACYYSQEDHHMKCTSMKDFRDHALGYCDPSKGPFIPPAGAHQETL